MILNDSLRHWYDVLAFPVFDQIQGLEGGDYIVASMVDEEGKHPGYIIDTRREI